MKFLRISYRVLILSFLVVMISNSKVKSDTPSCPECEHVDPTDEIAYEACVVLNGCSDQVDVPVTGNIWLLAMAGFVLAFVKFGGHTKLASYYFSKLEKQ